MAFNKNRILNWKYEGSGLIENAKAIGLIL